MISVTSGATLSGFLVLLAARIILMLANSSGQKYVAKTKAWHARTQHNEGVLILCRGVSEEMRHGWAYIFNPFHAGPKYLSSKKTQTFSLHLSSFVNPCMFG